MFNVKFVFSNNNNNNNKVLNFIWAVRFLWICWFCWRII